MCAGTHVMNSEGAASVMREAILYRPKSETSQKTKMRLYCGGRQRTKSFQVTLPAADLGNVRFRDSRLGIGIMRFRDPELEALGWQAGDEITHINGKQVKETDDLQELDPAATTLTVDVERPLEGKDGFPDPPPRLVVGAPLVVGDALLYDSRTFHWGMAHEGVGAEGVTRYVLYANFKSSLDHAGVHPEAMGTKGLRDARRGFQNYVDQLRSEKREGKGALEL